MQDKMCVLKIAVSGASGVGKTVLAAGLARALALDFIPEQARELCAEKGYERIGEIPDQEGFKREVLSRQIEKEAKFQSFVADRTSIDCWVLWQRWNICSAMTYDTESYYSLCREHSQSYSQIIYVPPLFEAQDDGFRWVEPDYIKQVDRIIRMTLFDFDLWQRVYTVRENEIDKRIDEVCKWLSKR